MEYRVLGPLEVRAGEGPLSLGGAKQRDYCESRSARRERRAFMPLPVCAPINRCGSNEALSDQSSPNPTARPPERPLSGDRGPARLLT
jgi:hypothetical protein